MKNSAEHVAAVSEDPFRTLVERLPAVTYVVELGRVNRTTYISPQIQPLLGFSQEEWIAKPGRWIQQLHPDDRDRVVRETQEKNKTGESFFLEYRCVRRDGRTIWVRNEAAYLHDHRGRPSVIHGVMLDITKRKEVEGASKRLAHDLGERVKELSCLFGMANLVERSGITLDEILQGVVELLPPTWQYPGDTCARLTVEQKVFTTENFKKTRWQMSADIETDHERIGLLEVFYLTKHPEVDEGPFLKEERMLLDVIAVRVGRTIQRIRAEEALAQARQRYADLVNNLNVGVYRNTPGPQGRFLEANPKIVEMFEAASREEFLQHGVVELYQDPAERLAFSEKMMRDGYVNDEELQLVTLRGRPFWGSVTAVRKTDEGGAIYFDGVVEDITHRKIVEQQLSLQSSALEAAANGIAITDIEGLIIWVNSAFTALTGYTFAEVIGQSTSILKSGKQSDAFYKKMWETILAGKVWRGEIINRHKDGSLYNEDMTITPVKDSTGATINFIAIKQDVTERIRTEAQVARYAELLQVRNTEYESDLKMASEVQEALLPQQYPTFPPSASEADSALRFCHRYFPGGAVGGDFFDVLPLSDTSVGVFLCDVMGHGMRAALVTAIVRGITEELTLVAHDPGEFLTELNRDFSKVFQHAERGMFATAFYLVADVRTGQMMYANAGHPSPLRVSRRREEVEAIPFESGARGPALGLIETAEYRTCSMSLDARDLVILFTDGLCEIERPDRETFGEERLRQAVESRLHAEPVDLFEQVVEEARNFSEGVGFTDDVCIVGIELARLLMSAH